MGTFANSMMLAKASWKVLRDDKQLALLPLLSMLTSLLVLAVLLVPIAVISHDGGTGGGTWTAKPLDWLLGIIGYFVVTYVVVFFNAALVWAADCRLRGEDVTIGEALHTAGSRAHVLLPWVLVSASVSVALRAIEERFGIAGRIVGTLVGIGWSLVTFLVLPILVVERLGPIQAVRRSAELFKRTWGEQVVSNAGIGIVGFLAIIVGAIPAGLLILIGGPIAILGVVVLVLWVMTVSLVTSALTGILQMALYRLAVDGTSPGFDEEALRNVFRTRRGRGFFG